ncbi:MAG: hypothetical protein VW547_04635 [Alphaproteobacteria bacterium]
MKLPGDYLKKAVDNDFARSGLAAELRRLDEDISLKTGTLGDLQTAIDRADGALRLELQHQFLEEKRAYLALMKEQQDVRRKRAVTKVRIYERLLSKMNASLRDASPQQKELLARQTAARQRFENSVAQIDTKLLQSSITAESRYSREYAKNLSAIEALVGAVKAHPINQSPQISGVPVTRAEYVRQLIAENKADLAIIDQEQSILAYMAKLVSLDALALSEGVVADSETVLADANNSGEAGLASSVEFFVSR